MGVIQNLGNSYGSGILARDRIPLFEIALISNSLMSCRATVIQLSARLVDQTHATAKSHPQRKSSAMPCFHQHDNKSPLRFSSQDESLATTALVH